MLHKFALIVLLVGVTFAQEIDGYKVYKNKCSSCHIEMMSKEEALKNLKKLKAPPMIEVSNRLKENIKTTDDEDDVNRYLFILFVKDYIVNPQLDNSMCRSGALEVFGTMPSLKGKISEEEKQAVAEWVYDRYEGVAFH
jgi:cytochrome c peroxidase